MERKKKMLKTGFGDLPYMPDEVPSDLQDLLDLMDHAAAIAGSAQGATAPAFDHGMRVFNQLYAHYQRHVAIQLSQAHLGLERATHALKVATWWLAIVTIGLGVIEVLKMFRPH